MWYQRAAFCISSIIYKVYENKVHNIAVLIAKLKKNYIWCDLEDTKIYSQRVINFIHMQSKYLYKENFTRVNFKIAEQILTKTVIQRNVNIFSFFVYIFCISAMLSNIVFIQRK